MKTLIALCCGSVFGLGLAVSGMTDTQKVIGFLDLFGQWQAELAFVMIGAIAVTFLGYRFVLKKPSPMFSEVFHLPSKSDIDRPLIIGAVLFGTGWGMVGYCPGPALASLAYANAHTALFVIAMVVGMTATHWLSRR